MFCKHQLNKKRVKKATNKEKRDRRAEPEDGEVLIEKENKRSDKTRAFCLCNVRFEEKSIEEANVSVSHSAIACVYCTHTWCDPVNCAHA